MTSFDSKKTALIVVDMQHGFCKEGGSLYSERNETIIPKLKTLIQKARNNGVQLIFTRDTHDKEFKTKHYNEFKRWGPHCVRGTKDTDIVPELTPQESDLIVEKGTYSGFFKTNIHQFLQEKGITTVLCTGVLTNVCVLHTASDAALNDYAVYVVKGCTEALSDDDKEYALRHIEWLFGTVVPSESIEFS